jgi:hypothetical protein
MAGLLAGRGRIINCMATGSSIGRTGGVTKVITKTTRSMDMAFSDGQMVDTMMEIGI